jgi:hypothetical protein
MQKPAFNIERVGGKIIRVTRKEPYPIRKGATRPDDPHKAFVSAAYRFLRRHAIDEQQIAEFQFVGPDGKHLIVVRRRAGKKTAKA